ncbi:S-layer homology domain-containing protein [Paenibacillus sp. MMO-58]|uniref:S-layer homology domain-containing protein n=1 Tax=Paenibacillus sp. MMO-58 TaxID=3081290 RepID=UPI003017B190
MQRAMKKTAALALVFCLFISLFPQMIFADAGSSSKDFLSFSVEGNPGIIDNVNHTIEVTVPFRSAVYNMLESFTVSDGATVLNHTSNVTRTDYSSSRTLTVVAEDNSTQDYAVTVTIGPSNLKSITSFNFTSPGVTGFIDDEAFLIYLYVPQGTDLTALKPTFATDDSGASVLVNGIVQNSGASAQDFTNPVTYTVQALDGSTRNYIVTAAVQSVPSTAKEITSFGLSSLSSIGTINEANHTITLTVPYGTDRTMLVPTFITTGTRVIANWGQQVSGEDVVDFSSPVDYVVFDEAGDSRTYTVTVQEAASNAGTTKELQTFGIDGVSGIVDEAAHTVTVVLPSGTTRQNKVASFTANGQFVSIGSTIQASGTTANDFTVPQTYTVFAENGLTQNYVVNVKLANELTSYKLTSPVQVNGVIDANTHTITLADIPNGTDLSAAKAEFVTTGDHLEINGVEQQSGVTATDLSSSPIINAVDSEGSSIPYTVVLTFKASNPTTSNPSVPTDPKPSEPTFKTVVDEEKLTADLKGKVEQAIKNPASTPFSDVSQHWGKANIDLFAAMGFITGYQDDTFRPNASITRAEFSAMIVRVFPFIAQGGTKTFTDVKESYWAGQDIKALAASGIITGYSDGTFRPDEGITRAEIIDILSRIVDFKAAVSEQTASFNDIAGVWNADDIRSAASAGIVNGRAEGIFAPQEQSTRAEALSMIARVLDLNKDIKALLDSFKA